MMVEKRKEYLKERADNLKSILSDVVKSGQSHMMETILKELQSVSHELQQYDGERNPMVTPVMPSLAQIMYQHVMKCCSCYGVHCMMERDDEGKPIFLLSRNKMKMELSTDQIVRMMGYGHEDEVVQLISTTCVMLGGVLQRKEEMEPIPTKLAGAVQRYSQGWTDPRAINPTGSLGQAAMATRYITTAGTSAVVGMGVDANIGMQLTQKGST